MKKRVVAGAVAGLAVAGGGGAIAATQFGSPQQESQAVVDDAAQQLGVQPSKLSAALKKALENRLDAAVAAGRITKAQGDELKQRIESGDLPIFGAPGRAEGPGFRHHGGPFGGLDAAAKYLGLNETQLRTRLESGNSLAAIAKAENKSVSGLVDAMVNDATSRLDADVKAGRLTQSQETQMLSDLKSHVTDFVNGVRPAFDHDRPPAGAPAPAAPSGTGI